MKRNLGSVISILALAILISIPGAVKAVEEYRVSSYGFGKQIWFEAEALDERIPEGDQYFKVTGERNTLKAPEGAFGEAVYRSGGAGGAAIWNFDISKAGGIGSTWYFWGRILNPDNLSDYLLVKGDPDDEIPGGPPFPGGDAVLPFDNDDDRIFEATVDPWGWWGREEGSTKELQNGENTMYIFHRQGGETVFWDVFMWTDDFFYRPKDEDYMNATPMEAGDIAVHPLEKLSTTWASIKKRL